MTPNPAFQAVAQRIEEIFREKGVRLTLGGEPTYVPVDPVGSEWSITALGPTKLRYAYAMADALVEQFIPNGIQIYSPGKSYPGEVNPRWAINILWNRDGSPLTPAFARKHTTPPTEPSQTALGLFCATLLKGLKVSGKWLRGIDSASPKRPVWILPIDFDKGRFRSDDWKLGARLELLGAQGPAGLRLPLNLVPPEVSRRALVIEVIDGRLHVFLPPLLQAPFLRLAEQLMKALHRARLAAPLFAGYIPGDELNQWEKLGLTADPGVLEINLPPCATWQEYDRWISALEVSATAAGLRSYKEISPDESQGTGGGNHLLFGGPSLNENPLFSNPTWITSILRYWQHHPSLSYLFTGSYVGPSSQAPRPDECASSLYDLEMAYQFLEKLPPGDHRGLISETLRHLHTDGSGNTHRSEVSFDKFWNINFDGGCRGLIEFRAVETLPHARWMSAVALLWDSIAAYLLKHPFKKPLIDHADRLHDYYFLPENLWADFQIVLRDLRKAGLRLSPAIYREIIDWRFPVMLDYQQGGARLRIRKSHEGWPLLCETPLEGGNTSRFVDTSIERLEFVADRKFVQRCQVYVQGRQLPFDLSDEDQACVGFRYRRTALYPSLHPGIAPQMPLVITIIQPDGEASYQLEFGQRRFQPVTAESVLPRRRANPCKKLNADLVTFDLRLP